MSETTKSTKASGKAHRTGISLMGLGEMFPDETTATAWFEIRAGRGPVGKIAVVGIKDRDSGKVAAKIVESVDGPTLRSFVHDHTTMDAEVFTDEHRAYRGLANHSTVSHSTREYVRGDVHTNGVESSWSMLKRAHKATFHKLSEEHLQRYVDEFVGRSNIRELDTGAQMESVVQAMCGRRLTYNELIAA